MVNVVPLLLLTLFTRWVGVLSREASWPRLMRLGGWVYAMTSVWVAVSLLGGWSPLWPVLPLALLGWASTAAAPRRVIEPMLDVLAAFVFAALSIPPLTLLATLGLVLLVLILGELVAHLQPKSMMWAVRGILRAAMALMLAAGVALLVGSIAVRWHDQPTARHSLFTPSMGVMLPTDDVQRIELATGATAWLRASHRPETGMGALVFHGAHPMGSRQKAARVIRRALVTAGYTALLVDHPGYGQTPLPPLDAPIDAWDPLPTQEAALRVLAQQPGVERIVIIGHSMGCVDVLRLLARGDQGIIRDKVVQAVLFGAGARDVDDRIDYWRHRFLSDRHLPSDALSADQIDAIRQRYYHADVVAQQLGSEHPPILFVRFDQEFANIRAGRGPLYAMLPGAKRVWDLRATHYFSTSDINVVQLAIGDVAVAGRVASRLRQLALDREADRADVTDGRAGR